MKFTSINGTGFKGLNSDISPWELSPEFITSGVNFRSSANRIVSAGSNEDWDAPSANINAGHVLPVQTSGGSDFWMVLGRASIEVFDGALWHDMSSAAGYSGLGADDELLWTSCMLGAIPVINNPQHAPEVWTPQQTTTILTPLNFDASNDWATMGYSFDTIRSHKNFLFALDLLENGEEFPNSYRWSHPADINGLPFTWDETDPSALAGKAQLGGDSGKIVDGWSLRDSFSMYSERGVNILDYTGDEFVWRRRELSSAFGIIAKNCIAEIKGTHFFLSDGDIVKNDGNRLESVVHNKIRKRLTSQMSSDYYDRSFVVRNTALKEIWFCVPEDGSEYPNVAYVYNWRDDVWSIHDLPANIVHAAYGPQSSPPVTYLTVPGTYDTTLLTYGSQKRTPLNSTVIGGYSDTSGLVILDPNDSTPGIDTDFFIERRDIQIGDVKGVKTITRTYPYMDGESPVTIQIGSSQSVGGTIDWTNEITFDPRTQRKIDIRSTGMLHAYRIRSIGDGAVSLTGMGIDYIESGSR